MPTLETMTALIAAWREQRHPRLGDLIDVLDAELVSLADKVPSFRSPHSAKAWTEREEKREPRDFTPLMLAIRSGGLALVAARVRALAAWDDPRLVEGLFALLDDPPATGTKAKALVDAIVAALEAARDPRVASRALELASRYAEIDDSNAGRRTVAALQALAARMEAIAVVDLPAPLLAQCAELEAALGPDAFARKRAASRSASERRMLEGLVALVYASPEDDEPRLVYADALLERGDPHGELITLQIARSRGDRTPVNDARERDLLTDGNKRAWAAPLSSCGLCIFERGFPEEVWTQDPISRRLARHPAWSLVTRLSGATPAALREMMAQPNFQRLHRLGWLRPENVDALDDGARARITDVELLAGRIADEALFRGFARLQELRLNVDAPVPERLLASLGALRKLELISKRASLAHRSPVRPRRGAGSSGTP